ncbi:MAG: glycosyltransferase [Deltaproteobacteria bacterium]|nr:glycosyltransferase [Deltaproteobacteria bacterium]
MKVLLVCGSFPPMRCGVGDYTSMLADALGRKAGVDVAVLTSKGAAPPRPDVPYRLLALEEGWRFPDLPDTVRAVREWSPDVVHFQYPAKGYGPLQWVLPSLFRAMGYPVYLTLHEYFGERDKGTRLSAALNLPNIVAARGIVVTREDYASLIPPSYARVMRRRQVKHIPIGANVHTRVVDEAERKAVRNRFAPSPSSLVSYFGFVSPNKGVDDIFRIADPERHHIVLIAELDPADPLHARILSLADTPPWKGRVSVTGFLPADEVARILACSDSVLLPFRNGSSLGNGTLHAALSQGTFTLSTSLTRRGYDTAWNAYFAAPGDIRDLSDALLRYSGRRVPRPSDFVDREWDRIAEDHERFYRRTG